MSVANNRYYIFVVVRGQKITRSTSDLVNGGKLAYNPVAIHRQPVAKRTSVVTIDQREGVQLGLANG